MSVHVHVAAFSQDLKSGCPKCTMEHAQVNNVLTWKIKQFSLISGCPQVAWTPIWLKAGSVVVVLNRSGILWFEQWAQRNQVMIHVFLHCYSPNTFVGKIGNNTSYMAWWQSCSRYNTRSEWLCVEHHSHVIPTCWLQACKSIRKSQ